MPLQFLPHTATRFESDKKDIPEYDNSGSFRCQIDPMNTDVQIRTYGREFTRGHNLLANLDVELCEGDRLSVEFASGLRWFKVVAEPMKFEHGLPTDHIECPLEQIEIE